jgi:very-short-patch-repair endonuclease
VPELIKCTFCHKEFKSIYSHIYKCHQRIKGKSNDDIREELILTTNTINVIQLVDQYSNQRLSLPVLKNLYGISYREITFLLKRNNTMIRSISESYDKQKIIDSCIKNLGVEWSSKSKDVKEKKRQTFLKHYGVDNIRKSPSFVKKIGEIMLAKYGSRRVNIANNPLRTQEEKEQYFRNLHSKPKKNSYLEQKFITILEQLGFEYCYQFGIQRRHYDFLLTEYNLILEINGDYWHANPKFYNRGDVLTLPGNRKVLVSAIWDYDLKKKQLAESRGFAVIYIWEQEIRKKTSEELQSLICNKIQRGLYENSINQKNRMQLQAI